MPSPRLHLLSASLLNFPGDWAMPSHAHAGFSELIVLIGGAVEARLSVGGTVIGRAGESLLYRRGVAHEERAVGGRPVSMVCLAFEGSSPHAEAPVVAADSHGRVRVLAEWLADLTASPPRHSATTERAVFTALLAERSTCRSSADELVTLVRQYLRDHLANPLSLDELAEVARLSPFHFSRRFRAAAGVAPMSFVRQMRVDAARALLLSTPMPLRAIAPLVGFADEFQLSRVFKRVTGLNPSSARSGRDRRHL